jgi:hypothetical protein
MRQTLLLGAALSLTSPLLTIPSQAAGTGLPHMKWAQSAASNGAIVEEAGWRRRCRRWNRKCGWRWGWRTGAIGAACAITVAEISGLSEPMKNRGGFCCAPPFHFWPYRNLSDALGDLGEAARLVRT